MKHIILFLLLTTISLANVKTIVSIAPELSILKAIGGDIVDVEVMVPKGASPHTYEPKPKQMIKLSDAKLYFAIGVEFEDAWLKKFEDQNSNLKVIKLYKDIKKINNNDHIWLNTKNLSVMAKEVFKALVSIDSQNKEFYKQNLQKYLSKLKSCHDEIEKSIKNKTSKVFITFHPAFTYFADEFSLREISIEVDGKEPSLKELLKVINIAKKEGVKTIVASPEFSDKSAKVIAKELDATVVKISPLSPNICNTLKLIANSLK